MKTQFLSLLLIGILAISCTSERISLMNLAEHVIPGTLRIESIRLPENPIGTTYHGNTFYVDTILFDIGRIEIPEFSVDSLNSEIVNPGKVRCTLTIGTESFPYSINDLFPSGEEIFSIFSF